MLRAWLIVHDVLTLQCSMMLCGIQLKTSTSLLVILVALARAALLRLEVDKPILRSTLKRIVTVVLTIVVRVCILVPLHHVHILNLAIVVVDLDMDIIVVVVTVVALALDVLDALTLAIGVGDLLRGNAAHGDLRESEVQSTREGQQRLVQLHSGLQQAGEGCEVHR